MTQRQKVLFGTTPLVVAALAGAAWMTSPGEGVKGVDREPDRALPVRVTAIEHIDAFTKTRSYAGVVAAHRTSRLGFERPGRVTEVLIEEGDDVKAGQPLAQLDRRHLEAQLAQLQAREQQAESQLAELEVGPRQQTIAASRSRLDDRVAQFDLANRNHQRNVLLFGRGAATKEQLDATALALESAAAQRDAAKDELDELEEGSRQEHIDAQRAVVKQLEAELQDLAHDMEDCTILAPYDGRISERLIDEGAFVGSGQAIVEIMETSRLEVRIGLPVSAANSFAGSDGATVTIDNQPIEVLFSRQQPAVDLQTRTQMVVFSLCDKRGVCVVPGSVARLEVEEVVSTAGFWLPTTALVRGPRGLWAVFAVVRAEGGESQFVERRLVELLYTEGDRSLVRGTLQTGDHIVTSGTQRVVPGQTVRILHARET